jgi:hypothetical protein
MNDVRKVIFGTIIGFFGMLALWFSIVYVSSCGLTFTCYRADPLAERTPIPTLVPVAHAETSMEEMDVKEFNKCLVGAGDLVTAWASAGASDTDAFPFTDVNTGKACLGTYADVQPLFVENSVWESGSVGCISCHNADLTDRSAGLDMSSYAAILESGIVENGKLLDYLGQGLAPAGHAVEETGGNPLVYVGSVVEEVEATPTP